MPANADPENVFVSRIESGVEAKAPGFDPTIIAVLIEALMALFSGMCGGDDVTPEEAVAKAKKLTRFQQAALKARLTRAARTKGVRDAKRISAITADVTEEVARTSTDEERIAFAKYLKPMTGDDFDIF